MKNQKLEELLAAAKPDARDIAPLSPEASSRILHAALRANRRKSSGSWTAMPWRVAMGAVAFGVMTFVLLPQVTVNDSDMQTPLENVASVPQDTAQLAADTTPAKPATSAKNAKPQASEKNGKTEARPRVQRPAPSVLPQPLRPVQMLAHRSTRRPMQTHASRRNVVAPREREATTRKPSLLDPEADSSLYVSVSGANSLPPAVQQEEGLIVSVTKNVPDSVPGVAEAASLQEVALSDEAMPMDGSGEQTIPVWTHARVQSGADPTVTLTALR